MSEQTIERCEYCGWEVIMVMSDIFGRWKPECRNPKCVSHGSYSIDEAIEVHNRLARNNAAAGALADAWAVLKTYPSIECDLTEMFVLDDELTLDAQGYRDALIAMNEAAALAKTEKEPTDG